MEELHFFVQGSSDEPYQVRFVRRSSSNLSAYCTCPSGQNGLYCKHRFAILDGITKNIISENYDDVKVVLSWLPGTDIDIALQKTRSLEKQAAQIKKMITASKKELARAMRD